MDWVFSWDCSHIPDLDFAGSRHREACVYLRILWMQEGRGGDGSRAEPSLVPCCDGAPCPPLSTSGMEGSVGMVSAVGLNILALVPALLLGL